MARKKTKRSESKAPSEAETGIDKETEERHVAGLVTRGEAVKAEDGELPLGATHEIVEEREGELPKVRRRRFTLF